MIADDINPIKCYSLLENSIYCHGADQTRALIMRIKKLSCTANSFGRLYFSQYCFDIVCARTALILRIDGWRTFSIQPGHMCIINPGEKYTISPIHRTADCLIVQLDWEYVLTKLKAEGYVNMKKLAHYVYRLPETSFARICMLEKILSENETDLIRIYGLMASFADDILHQHMTRFLPRKLPSVGSIRAISLVCRAALQIRRQCFTTVNLQSLADEASLSYGHFSRIFKSCFGVSPSIYKTNLQLMLARHLLLASSLSVAGISRICGYVNCSHFIRAYEKKFSLTPNRDRKKCLDKLSSQGISRNSIDMKGFSLYDFIIIQE